MRKAILFAVTGLVIGARTGAAQCGGVERWAVKVGADPDASLIDSTTRVTELDDLVRLPRPTLPSDDITRRPAEREVRTVFGRLRRFKLESGKTGDSDFHLVITDDTRRFTPGGEGPASPHSFIAEIPDPACVMGRDAQITAPSRFAAQLAAVHARFRQEFPSIQSGWNEVDGIPVRVTGVVFFDRPHGQVGRALNGVELHPVLDIAFNPTDSVPPAIIASSNVLADPGFELGGTDWTATDGVIRGGNGERPRSGTHMAWLGGYGTAHTDRLWQRVVLPASAGAVTLSFYLHVSTEEEPTAVKDRLRVRVRATNGTLLRTLGIVSNLDAADGFVLRSYDLTPWRGRTVRLSFEATETGSQLTSFVVDDVAVEVRQP